LAADRAALEDLLRVDQARADLLPVVLALAVLFRAGQVADLPPAVLVRAVPAAVDSQGARVVGEKSPNPSPAPRSRRPM